LVDGQSGTRVVERCFAEHASWREGCSNARIAARMWIAALRSGGPKVGSASIEGGALGHCRSGWQTRTAATVPVPAWCKNLVDVWLRHSRVNEDKAFRQVPKNGARQDAGVTANVGNSVLYRGYLVGCNVSRAIITISIREEYLQRPLRLSSLI
jgi:hypothetical protein